MKPIKIVGWALIAVAAIDLSLGNTGQSPLPAFITNMLSQQMDLVLIGVGAFLVFFL